MKIVVNEKEKLVTIQSLPVGAFFQIYDGWHLKTGQDSAFCLTNNFQSTALRDDKCVKNWSMDVELHINPKD